MKLETMPDCHHVCNLFSKPHSVRNFSSAWISFHSPTCANIASIWQYFLIEKLHDALRQWSSTVQRLCPQPRLNVSWIIAASGIANARNLTQTSVLTCKQRRASQNTHTFMHTITSIMLQRIHHGYLPASFVMDELCTYSIYLFRIFSISLFYIFNIIFILLW